MTSSDFNPTDEEMLAEGWALNAEGVWVKLEELPLAKETEPKACKAFSKCGDTQCLLNHNGNCIPF
jgi:hypothetical protein